MWVTRWQRIVRSLTETPESRTQVFMTNNGAMEVYNNVVFEANSAEYHGGAVSLPINIGSHLPFVAL